eukprot:m.100109 g.100109  ORF g.100109 m.100109 type:complete len:218 (-) comp16775_c1_seq6:922-1575(-)
MHLQAELEQKLPVQTPDPRILSVPTQPSEANARITWLGHSSCLVQWQGWSVLSDPIFSERCSPVSWAGHKRVRPSPVQVEQIQLVDVVVISHNHFDHLDAVTVQQLCNSHPGALFCVPLGMKTWFARLVGRDKAAQSVIEMDWGDEIAVTDALVAKPKGIIGARPPLTVACVPCQHWCRRTLTDLNKCKCRSTPDVMQVPRAIIRGAREVRCRSLVR